ncbi:MAG: GHKL domain-containing protein [Bacteroidales bacterium]|nr:GHKL domain-containing protein [Bacteroidales bacterium]
MRNIFIKRLKSRVKNSIFGNLIDFTLEQSRSYTYRFLFLAVASFAVGTLMLLNNFGYHKNVSRRDVVQFQEVIVEKQKFAQSLQEQLVSLPDSADFGVFEDFRMKHSAWIESQNLSFFIFENKKILYWSDNSIPPYFQLLSQESKLFFSGNAWYLLENEQKGNRTFFVLMLIKKQFPFENSNIRNEFQRDFTINNSVEIYNEPCDNTHEIYDSDGNFLLALSNATISETSKWKLVTPVLLFVLSFAFFVLFLGMFPKKNWIYSVVAYLLLFGVAFVMMKQVPKHIMLYHECIVILVLAYIVFTLKKVWKSEILSYVIFSIVSFVLCGTATGFIKSLALHSGIEMELFNLLSTNAFSFIAYFEIASLLFLYFAFCFRFSRAFEFDKKYSLPLLVGICLLTPSLTFFLIKSPSEFFPYLFGFYFITVISIVLFAYFRRHESPTFALKLVFLVATVIYTETAISIYLDKHKAENRYELAKEWANEQDPVAEQFLASVYKSTRSDIALQEMMKGVDNQDIDIKNFLLNMYFYGWLGQYDLECTVCGTDSAFAESNRLPNCEAYFQQMVSSSGKHISDTNYYYINNQDGNITYFDAIEFKRTNSSVTKLYIELHSKNNAQIFGYPTILLDNVENNEFPENYSMAKYKNGILISKRGKCPYSQKLALCSDQEQATFIDEQHHTAHLAYKINDQYTVVVSNRTYQLKNYVMWFPYIFLLFFLLMLIFVKCFDRSPIQITHSLSAQIKRSQVGLLIGSFILVAVSGTLFIKSYNSRQQRQFLEEKIASVAKEISQQYKDFAIIPADDKNFIQNKLTELANIYSSDVNLYDTNGDLIASSRPEIFQFRLVNEKMATRAFFQLIKQSRSTFSQEETIGNLHFTSAYISIINSQNTVLGYLNLPNFNNEEDFKQQFAGLFVSLLNLFVVFLLIATIFSMFIAKRISEPLVVLQNKMTNVALGGENEKISLNAPDELEGVIQNYNEMIDKLSVSAEKLAKAEREMAWREMARQIAHEIKNPLTPMKLSLQLLNRSWDEKDERFESRLKSISKTMIEQIDTLAETATSFSDFAKLSKVLLEPINLNELLQNCITLFEQEDNCTITSEFLEENVIVCADKEKTIRMFNNLLKNAIQAIPSDREGHVSVTLKTEQDFALVAIRDNGRGIDDDVKKHIFELHFTTKSTGSGFGLAICKNIVEGCNGDIWFETELGVGTTFFVKLPLQKA